MSEKIYTINEIKKSFFAIPKIVEKDTFFGIDIDKIIFFVYNIKVKRNN